MTRTSDPMSDQLHKVFENFRAYREEISKVLILSRMGVGRLSREDKFVDALANWKRTAGKFNAEQHEKEIGFAREIAEFSTREMQRGFPILHMHAVVALWTSIETLAKDFMACWLRHNPDILKRGQLKKLKI